VQAATAGGAANVLIDLSRVTVMDTSGTGVLIMACHGGALAGEG